MSFFSKAAKIAVTAVVGSIVSRVIDRMLTEKPTPPVYVRKVYTLDMYENGEYIGDERAFGSKKESKLSNVVDVVDEELQEILITFDKRVSRLTRFGDTASFGYESCFQCLKYSLFQMRPKAGELQCHVDYFLSYVNKALENKGELRLFAEELVRLLKGPQTA